MFVEKMGGCISAYSIPFEGTTFLVRLPEMSEEANIRENEHDELDNKRIISMMNIEFSDIYLEHSSFLNDLQAVTPPRFMNRFGMGVIACAIISFRIECH